MNVSLYLKKNNCFFSNFFLFFFWWNNFFIFFSQKRNIKIWDLKGFDNCRLHYYHGFTKHRMISEIERGMLGCKCLYWNNLREFPPLKQPETFSLPASIPQWPSGRIYDFNFIFFDSDPKGTCTVSPISPESDLVFLQNFWI